VPRGTKTRLQPSLCGKGGPLAPSNPRGDK
jgi:hypothetical protein